MNEKIHVSSLRSDRMEGSLFLIGVVNITLAIVPRKILREYAVSFFVFGLMSFLTIEDGKCEVL
jgi:hypothetical protein